MDFPRRPALAIAIAALLPACSIYTPDFLSNDNGTAGPGVDSSTQPTCGKPSDCIEAGPEASLDVAEASRSDDALAADSEAAIAPYVTGMFETPITAIGLSGEGRYDWAHWGLKRVSDYNHKALAQPIISTLATMGNRPVTLYTGSPITFSWTDGTPTALASTNNGVQISDLNQGFVVTVPSSSEVRTLRLYVGVYNATAHLLARLSDSDVPSKFDDHYTSTVSDQWSVQVATVEFLDGKPGTKLTVSWFVEAANPTGSPIASVQLSAVTLY